MHFLLSFSTFFFFVSSSKQVAYFSTSYLTISSLILSYHLHHFHHPRDSNHRKGFLEKLPLRASYTDLLKGNDGVAMGVDVEVEVVGVVASGWSREVVLMEGCG